MTHQFKWRTIHALLSLRKVPDADLGWSSFNVAPTQSIPVVRNAPDDPAQREIAQMRWGLIPSWAKDRKIAASLINARGETVSVKPAFRSAFKHRRCIVPATGFYEWKRTDPNSKTKQPYYFHRRDGQPLLLAGLWESWTDHDTGELIDSCTIITTTANADVQFAHDRMPVILEPPLCALWLDTPRLPGAGAPDQLTSLLIPAPAETLISHAVSTRVNSPKNNDASLIDPSKPAAGS